MPEPIRLAKRVSEMLPCSRREAELYIEGGFVTVDGVVVQEPMHRVDNQTIVVLPNATLTPAELVTVLFHQPATEIPADLMASITPDNHAPDDFSGIRPLKRHFSKLSATLPLERKASGLVVFTQDFRTLRHLVDDAGVIEQEYVVEVTGTLGPHGLKQLNQPYTYNGKARLAAKVSWQNETRLRFALKGAQAGQITHMCETAGLSVTALKRIRIGKVSMAKLPLGQWRYAPINERF